MLRKRCTAVGTTASTRSLLFRASRAVRPHSTPDTLNKSQSTVCSHPTNAVILIFDATRRVATSVIHTAIKSSSRAPRRGVDGLVSVWQGFRIVGVREAER
jgi:hypothetical protein